MSSTTNHTPTQPVEILVCDDMVANVKMLSGLLRADGYRVRVAIGGAAAVRAVAHRVPDLVIMDVVMPQMDGYQACRQLHALPGAELLPVIFVSSLMESDDKVQAFSSGGIDYITKP